MMFPLRRWGTSRHDRKLFWGGLLPGRGNVGTVNLAWFSFETTAANRLFMSQF